QHVVVTYDGNAGSGQKLKFYVNDVLKSTTAFVDSGGSPGHSNNSAKIGAAGSLSGNYFAGLIDEVELFSRVLTTDEIQFIYDAGSFGKCKPTCVAPPSGLIDWWPADNTAIDIQGGHNGTLKNGATFDNGKVDRAFRFDGQSAYVDAGLVDFGATTTLSVDAWVNCENPSNGPVIIHNYDGSAGIFFALLNSGYAEFDVV